MNLEKASKEQKADIEKRLLKGYGELIEVDWVDLEKETVEEEGKKTFKQIPVPRKNTYYVGKMNAGMAGPVTQVFAGIVGGLMNNGEGEGEGITFSFDLLSQVLNDENINYLLSVILGEERAWIDENFDPVWAVRVLGAFFKHNDFFALLNAALPIITEIAEKATTLDWGSLGG